MRIPDLKKQPGWVARVTDILASQAQASTALSRCVNPTANCSSELLFPFQASRLTSQDPQEASGSHGSSSGWARSLMERTDPLIAKLSWRLIKGPFFHLFNIQASASLKARSYFEYPPLAFPSWNLPFDAGGCASTARPPTFSFIFDGMKM